MEIGLGTDQVEHVGPALVGAVAHHRARPGQLGGHPVHDAGHGPPGPLVQEVLAVEGDHRLGLSRPSSAAMAVAAPRPASTQPSSETTSTGFVAAGSRWTSKSSVSLGAHGAFSSASAAISKSRPICTGKPSTDPWSPAPAPAT